ncbi:hypothetical protein LCGC14_2308750, partial [marine sediment metagenome]
MSPYMKEVVNDRQTTINHNFVTGHEYEFVVRAVGPDGTEEAIEHAVRDVVDIVGEQFPPDVPTTLTATGFLLSISLAWVNPTNYDMDKMEIWRSELDDVTGAVKIAEVRGTSYLDSIGESGITRYYWIKAVDTSGNVSGFYPLSSTGVSATTVGVVATDIDDFAVTATKMFNKTIILTGDAWINNSPGAGSVAWNAHNVVYNGAAYPISAGNTASPYIYWTIGNTTYSSGASHPTLGTTAFMVAINTSGIHTLVWNSSANMVIGTAFIANLAVTNAKIALLAVDTAQIALLAVETAQINNLAVTDAKINTLTANKLTAGTIDASVITVTNLNATNLTAGTLPVARVGATSIESSKLGVTVITGGKIVTGLLTATNIQTGTLTGRRVQTASSGQRIVLDVADNTLKMYDAGGGGGTLKVLIDDNLPSVGVAGVW